MAGAVKLLPTLQKRPSAIERIPPPWWGTEQRDTPRSQALGKESQARSRQFPETWQMGQALADDRFAILRDEDRPWSFAMVDAYLTETGSDAVRMVDALARQQDHRLDPDKLRTVAIAFELHLEAPLLKYIRSGWADIDRRAIREHRADYDRGRRIADITFDRRPAPWLATAPSICTCILALADMQTWVESLSGIHAPKLGPDDVALSGFRSRMAERVRERLLEASAWTLEDPSVPRRLEIDQHEIEKPWAAGPRRARRFVPARS